MRNWMPCWQRRMSTTSGSLPNLAASSALRGRLKALKNNEDSRGRIYIP